MNIGLLDIDGHNFPNLALMKLSAYHKKQGDAVDWVNHFNNYDIVYQSKVFTYSQDNIYHINAEKIINGGTGYKDYNTILTDEIEHIYPDYTLYKTKHAYGFLTRGCPNKCSWCVVPQKEGNITAHADIDEFRGDFKSVILLDNNALSSEWGLKQIEKIVDLRLKVDFNQGLDARIIADDKDIAKLLSRVRWMRYIRLACDTKGHIPQIQKAVDNLKEYGIKSYKVYVYMLVKEVDDALERANFLNGLGVTPFAQPYIDFIGTKPTIEQRRLARWVNHKAIFKSVHWNDYKYKT